MAGARIQLKRATASSWASNNPVLYAGEIGYETDTKKFKIGDGTTAYNSLSYFNGNLSGSSLNDLADVTIVSATNGDFLRWNGTAWINDAVNLSTDTIGSYVESLVAGTGVTLANNSGEGATPTVAIGQDVGTSASVTFAHVSASVTGSLSGNASTASTLQNTRTIELSGDVTGSVSFDGSSNVNIATTVVSNGVELGVNTTGDYVESLVAGTGITLSNNSGESANPTVAIGQDVATTASVAFAHVSAPITGNVLGNLTGDVTGNALTASTLQTARAISLAGDLSGSVSFDGSQNVTITAVVEPNSVVLGTDTTGNYMSDVVAGTGISIIHTPGESSSASISIGQDVSTSASVTFAHVAADVTGDLIGNADTATTLQTARAISLAGDLSGSVSFDGSQNVTITAQVEPNSVVLGTDTTGNFVSDVVAGTGVSITHTPGEGSSASIAIGQSVGTSDNPSFAGLTADGVQIGISNATEIDTVSGNLTIDSAGGTVTVDDNLVITGSLTVSGSATYVNTETLTVDDNVILLNSNQTGSPSQNAGIEIERGSSDNVQLRWNEATDSWEITEDGTTYKNIAVGQDVETSSSVTFAHVTAPVSGNATTASALQTARAISLSGDLSGSASFDGSANITITADVQPNSVALGTDTTGNYMSDLTQSTGVIITHTPGEGSNATIAIGQDVGTSASVTFAHVSAPITGNITGDVSGNAGTATALQNARAISLGGDLSGSVSFNGTSDVTITATVQPNSVALGTDTTGNYMSDLTQGTGVTITHTPGEGSNATIAIGQAVGTSSSVTFAAVTAPLVGNASTATTLQNARAISLGGDLSGSVSFDGSTDVTITAAVQPNSVALGTDTTGNYVSDVAAGTGVSVTHTPGEGSSPTIAIGQAVGTSASVQFAQISTTGNVTIGGDLTVNGTTTTVNTETINLADNIIVLNSNETSAPSQNAGIEIERGSSENVSIRWNEATDSWEITEDGTTYRNIASGQDVETSSSVTFAAVTAPLIGNASTATNLQTARAISLGGDLSGSASFDGSANITITADVQPNSVALGTDTTGNFVNDITAGTGVTVSHTPGEGSSPTVSIGQAVGTSSSVTFAHVSADVTGALTGNASTATALQTARTIELSGDVSGSASFNGTSNINISTTVNTASVSITELGGVNITNPEEFQGLSYNGTSWVNSHIPLVSYVRNAEATTLTTGTVVYLFGGTGDHASVKRADNNSDATSSKTVGVVGAPIASGQNGPVVTRGYVDGIDLSAYSTGEILWLNANGQFITTKPTAPKHMVFVGVVVRATNNGIMYVAVQNGYELNELHDVKVNGTTDGQFLRYNSASAVWIADTINLGTDTVGDYVQNLVAGTGVTLSNNSGEGSTPTITIGQDVGTSSSVVFHTLETTHNITIGGNLYVSGSVVTENQTSLAIDDPFIYLNVSSSVSNVDLGIAGNYNDGTYRHAGIFRDSTDGKFKFFDSYEPEPSSPIDVQHVSYSPAPVVAETFESTVTTGTAPFTVASTTEVANLHADTATTLHTSRAISFGGDLSGSASFDGSGDITITAAIQPDSVVLGTDTTGNYMVGLAEGTGVTIVHTPGEASTASVSIGQSVATSASVTFAHVSAPISGNVTGNVTGDVSGNAGTATALQNSRTISLGGDLSGSVSFNGTSDVTINASVQPNSVALGVDTTGNYVSDVTAGTGVTVTHTPGEGSSPTIAIGQAVGTSSSVQFAQVTTTGDVVIGGNITVNGTQTVLNTDVLSVEDNIIILNSNASGAPTLNAGIEINRGSSPDVSILWNEANDSWQATEDGTNFYDIAFGQNVFTSSSVQFANVTSSIVGDVTGKADRADRLEVGRAISLSGDLSGSVAFDGTQNVTLNATIQPDSVVLGSDTTGNYVSDVTGGTGITVNHTAGEGSAPQVSLNANLNDINDVNLTIAPADGQFLKYVGASAAWVSADIPQINSLNDIADVTITSASVSQILQWNGSVWINANPEAAVTISDNAPGSPSEGDLWFDSTTLDTFVRYDSSWIQLNDSGSPIEVLDDLFDVSVQDAEPDQFLKYDGTEWVPASPILPIAINTRTANYTLTLNDANRLVEMNMSVANTVTVPANSSHAIPIGSKIEIFQYGSGKTQIIGDTGVTIRTSPGSYLAAQYSYATLVKRGTNEWILFGDLSAS